MSWNTFNLMVWQRLRPHTVACGRIQWPGSCSATATHSHRRHRLCPQNRRAFLHHEVMQFKANSSRFACRCAKAEPRQTMQHSRAVCTSTLLWQPTTRAMALELGGAKVLEINAAQGLEAINSDVSNAVILHVWKVKQTPPRPDAVAHRSILRVRSWCGTAPRGWGGRGRCGQWRL